MELPFGLTRLPNEREDYEALTDDQLSHFVHEGHLYAQDSHQRSRFRANANSVLTERIEALDLPVSKESIGWTHNCDYCGQVFMPDNIGKIRGHFNDDGTCVNGFNKDYKCCCGREFSTLTDANRHRLNADCLGRKRELERLYCKACEFQPYSKKQLDEHCATKQHYLKTHTDEFVCKTCDIKCRGKAHYMRHCEGKQHIFKSSPDARPKLYCETCDVKCLSQKQYQTHLATKKHLKLVAASGSQ